MLKSNKFTKKLQLFYKEKCIHVLVVQNIDQFLNINLHKIYFSMNWTGFKSQENPRAFTIQIFDFRSHKKYYCPLL